MLSKTTKTFLRDYSVDVAHCGFNESENAAIRIRKGVEPEDVHTTDRRIKLSSSDRLCTKCKNILTGIFSINPFLFGLDKVK